MRQCNCCGAYLDPQEICDCQQEDEGQTIACVAPPVITENIASVHGYLATVSAKLAELPKDKDGCSAAKAMRADLRRKLDKAEEQRKAVKKAVLEPYNAAERKYKEQIAEPMQKADQELKVWIDDYQNSVKQACQQELEEYFDELCGALHIDFVLFSDVGIKVDMATANLQDPKKARNAIHDFLNRVEDDLRAISTMEHSAEILAEYKVCKNLPAAIAAVNERLSREQKAAAELEKQKPQEVQRQAVLEAPVVIHEEKKVKCTFTVTATKTQLKALKEFMNTEGIVYE